MLDYLVVYESETGNTKKIATEIFASLPGMSKDLINLHERTDSQSQNLFCRFLCSPRNLQPRDRQLPFRSVVQIRCSLWTCGAGNSLEYYKKIASSVRIWLEDDNRYLGSFICQGKMPLAVRQKYESLLNTPEDCDCQQIRRQLQNFDEAMIHPTRTDLENAALFATECIEKVKSM